MFKTKLIIVMATLCLFFKVNGQRPANITPLKIGDSIPDEIWNLPLTVVNHPTGQQSITLGEYKNKKLIILDFWATYCSPCIESLQKLDTLQQYFKDEFIVLPVLVYDLEENALPFMQKKNWKWPSVTGDTTFNKQLFVRYITGFGNAWIVDGKLYAIPRPDNITHRNIASVISGTETKLQNLKQQF